MDPNKKPATGKAHPRRGDLVQLVAVEKVLLLPGLQYDWKYLVVDVISRTGYVKLVILGPDGKTHIVPIRVMQTVPIHQSGSIDNR